MVSGPAGGRLFGGALRAAWRRTARERGGAGGRRPAPIRREERPQLREELASREEPPRRRKHSRPGEEESRGCRVCPRAGAGAGRAAPGHQGRCVRFREELPPGGGRRRPKTLLGQVEGLPSEDAAVRRGELWNCCLDRRSGLLLAPGPGVGPGRLPGADAQQRVCAAAATPWRRVTPEQVAERLLEKDQRLRPGVLSWRSGPPGCLAGAVWLCRGRACAPKVEGRASLEYFVGEAFCRPGPDDRGPGSAWCPTPSSNAGGGGGVGPGVPWRTAPPSGCWKSWGLPGRGGCGGRCGATGMWSRCTTTCPSRCCGRSLCGRRHRRENVRGDGLWTGQRGSQPDRRVFRPVQAAGGRAGGSNTATPGGTIPAWCSSLIKDDESAPVRDKLEICREIRNLLTHSCQPGGGARGGALSAPVVEALGEVLAFVPPPAPGHWSSPPRATR